MDIEEYRELAQAGKQLLEEKAPWYRESYDHEVFDIQSPKYCMVGLTFRNYGNGMQRLFGDSIDRANLSEQYGFELPDEVWETKDVNIDEEWNKLQQAWLEVMQDD